MTSRLAEMQARFQQKQIQEREGKLLRLLEDQQQKTIERVSRGSAGSLGSTGGGKVRQMFDERRQKAGVDKSYPLEPLKGVKQSTQRPTGRIDRATSKSTNVSNSKTVIKTNVHKSVSATTNTLKTIVRKEESISNNSRKHNVEKQQENIFNTRFEGPRDNLDLVDMMNNHNLHDLDKEEMPEDILLVNNKNESIGSDKPQRVEKKTILGKPMRKDAKPIVRQTIKSASSSQGLSSTSPASKPLRTPFRSTSQIMDEKGSKKTASQSRSPANTRPSAKQSGKSPVVRDDLNECKFCHRRFAADRLEVHESICGKSHKKKRKTYDATKHRVEGTELEQYVSRKPGKNAKHSGKQPTKKDWRRTHEEFINTIRAAKVAQAHVAKGGKLSDLPPPPPSSNPDYVQCPHCGRKFNESAAERHIPKCASFVFNKTGSGVKGRK